MTTASLEHCSSDSGAHQWEVLTLLAGGVKQERASLCQHWPGAGHSFAVGRRTPPTNMDGAVVVLHGWVRPRAIQGYRETPSLTLPCRPCLETQRDLYEQETLMIKLWKSEVRTCWPEADAGPLCRLPWGHLRTGRQCKRLGTLHKLTSSHRAHSKIDQFPRATWSDATLPRGRAWNRFCSYSGSVSYAENRRLGQAALCSCVVWRRRLSIPSLLCCTGLLLLSLSVLCPLHLLPAV